MRNSTILCPVNIEYGREINIFVLKMMMKSGIEKIILKFLHAHSLFWKIFLASKKGGLLYQIANSVIKMTLFADGGISIKLFMVQLHIINECLSYKFHPYSILTGQVTIEWLMYQVLSTLLCKLSTFLSQLPRYQPAVLQKQSKKQSKSNPGSLMYKKIK